MIRLCAPRVQSAGAAGTEETQGAADQACAPCVQSAGAVQKCADGCPSADAAKREQAKAGAGGNAARK